MFHLPFFAGVGIIAGGAALVLNRSKTKNISADRSLPKSSDGWIQVADEISGAVVSLPEHTKVQLTKTENNREYFIVLEGLFVGQTYSIRLDHSGESLLNKNLPTYRGGATLSYSNRSKILSTPIGPFQSEMDKNNLIPSGLHQIQLPDAPHEFGRKYLARAKKALCWFHIDEGFAEVGRSERYLHTGRVSEGCVTVTEVEK